MHPVSITLIVVGFLLILTGDPLFGAFAVGFGLASVFGD